MSPPVSVRTHIVIFGLFGEYIVPRGGRAWTTALLRLLGVLGISERAARSTLSRMSQKGWLASERDGRYSRYAITPRGLRVIREGEVRIFEPRRKEWDGRWHMVVYSVPEGRRRLRGKVRTRLRWLGFGRLAPGTWISPTDRRAEVEGDLDDLNAREYALYFSGMELHFATPEEIVRRCWDLEAINEDYAAFLEYYEPRFRDFQEAFQRGEGPDPEACFRERFWLALAYAQFPRRDPNLPERLLPPGWLGTRANEVFRAYYELLKEPAERFVDLVVGTDPRPAHLRAPEPAPAGGRRG